MGVRRTWWGRRRAMGSAVAAVAVLALAGCASIGGSGTTPGAGGGDGSGGQGDGRPLLQVVNEGGFGLMGADFSRVPQLTVYPDGTVISHGAQIMIFPGPALPALVSSTIDSADLEALISAAGDAGLLTEATEYGAPPVADAGRTVVTLRIEGQEYVHTVEALGTGDGTEMVDPVTGEGEAQAVEGVSAEQQEARLALSSFLAEAHGLAESEDSEMFEFDGFGIFTSPAPEGAETMEQDIERQVVAWPVEGVDLAGATECVSVTGEDGATLHGALVDANQLTLWEQDGTLYEVFVRPLLPHESSCEDLV